ncbi:hypothetical protein HYS42_01855 [Candidatus Saccharibacteria bacterium]|nr:hypothetical protein [Candidatus Saccharibacteria bacterium]
MRPEIIDYHKWEEAAAAADPETLIIDGTMIIPGRKLPEAETPEPAPTDPTKKETE